MCFDKFISDFGFYFIPQEAYSLFCSYSGFMSLGSCLKSCNGLGRKFYHILLLPFHLQFTRTVLHQNTAPGVFKMHI